MKRKTHRLFVREIIKGMPVKVDDFGRRFVPVRWIERESINLGSINKPNKNVVEIKLEPIFYD